MRTLPPVSPRLRVLCVAAALALPVPLAIVGPLDTGVGFSSAGTDGLHGAAMSTIGPPAPAPHTPGATDQSSQSAGERPRDGHDGPAVVNKSVHQRIAEISANTTYDVPLAALNAYRRAAASVAYSYPGCQLSWGVIAAIGQVESGHGRFGGAQVLANGTTWPIILGLRLNGKGPVAAIRDTDDGKLDGDTVWDRAVGPMQFIPSTWAALGTDGDGNGKVNPHDFDDASLSTARYLCSGGGTMSILSSARAAVYRYNQSDEYVDLVLTLANAYDSGVVDVVPNEVAPPKTHHPRRHQQPQHRPVAQQPRPRDNPRPGPGSPDPSPPRPDPKPQPPKPPKPPPPPPPPPPPEPVVKTFGGQLVRCASDTRFCVAGVQLQLAALPAGADYDEDNAVESVNAELRGVIARAGIVTVTTTDGLVTAFQVDSMADVPLEPEATEQPPTAEQSPASPQPESTEPS